MTLMNRPRFGATRRWLAGVGCIVPLMLSLLAPWLDRVDGGLALGSTRLGAGWVVALGVLGLVTLASVVVEAGGLIGLWRQASARVRLMLLALAVMTALLLEGVWYAWLLKGELQPWELRPGAAVALGGVGVWLLSTALAGLERRALRLGAFLSDWRAVAIAAGLTVVVSAGIARLVLDGMPYMSDALTYLLQGRVLFAGRLTVEAPAALDLFTHSVFFRLSDAGYHGKYPIGFPLVLGAFDALTVPWLANPVLAGALVVLTWWGVRDALGRRIAGWTALVMVLCPWLWFNGATQMSHLAAAVWAMAFAVALHRTLNRPAWRWAAAAGLALGMLVLTRPSDAAFFALPLILIAAFHVLRQPRRHLPAQLVVAAATLPGLIAYLTINRYLAGASGQSTYGRGVASELISQSPRSFGHLMAWYQECLAAMSEQWMAGVFPVVLLVLAGGWLGRRHLRRPPLFVWGALSLALCYGVFIYHSRPWVGPRWYVPLIPAAAMLIAVGVVASIRRLRAAERAQAASPSQVGPPSSMVHDRLAGGYLRLTMTAWLVGVLLAAPAVMARLIQTPPHGVDGRMARAIREANLDNAVVGLPLLWGDDRVDPSYKDPRAGLWIMAMPFEANPVIVVRGYDGWEQDARQSWPDRTLYEVSPVPGDFTLRPVTPEP